MLGHQQIPSLKSKDTFPFSNSHIFNDFGLIIWIRWREVEWQDLVKSRGIWSVNSLAPGKFSRNFKNIISEHMLRIEFIRNYSENDFRWMPQDNVGDKWALVQVMVWCLTVPRHYLNQCWPRSKPSYGTTWPQWINTVLIVSEAMVDLPRYCKWLRIWLMIGNDEVCCRIMSFNLISVLWQDTNWIGFGSCTIKTSCFTVSLNMFGKTNYRHMNDSDKSVLFVEEMESSWFFQHLNQILQFRLRCEKARYCQPQYTL